MKACFVTYASDGFEHNARLLCENAARWGFDTVYRLGPEAIAGTDFSRRNSAILSASRGGGFWLWKPYLIRQLADQLSEGEILLYSDAGRSAYYQFSRFPLHLLEWTARSEQGFLTGITIPHLGAIGKWTKRDCLQIMEADTPAIHDKPMVQATWSVWTKTRPALDFLDAWLRFGEDPRCITDAPNELGKNNLFGFVDHRHDQSICSILAHRLSAPFLDFSGTLVQRLLDLRPNSELGNTFYKRAQNASDLLDGATPAILVREYLRLRSLR